MKNTMVSPFDYGKNHEEFRHALTESGYYGNDDQLNALATAYRDLGTPEEEYILDTRQFKGSLEPLTAMWKDFVDTFKRYKHQEQTSRDLWQPINGIKNIFYGLSNLLMGVVVSIGYFLKNVLFDFYDGITRFNGTKILISPFANIFHYGVVCFLPWVLNGTLNIVRGLTQVISSPLVYLIKWPFRAFVLPHWQNEQLIEQNTGITQLVEQLTEKMRQIQPPRQRTGDAFVDNFVDDLGITFLSCKNTCDELHRKYLKAKSRNQPSQITSEDELRFYNNLGRNPTAAQINQYLSLFRGENPPLNQPLPPEDTNTVVRVGSNGIIHLFNRDLLTRLANSGPNNPNENSQASREERHDTSPAYSSQTPLNQRTGVTEERSLVNNSHNFRPAADSIHSRLGCIEEINTADVERRARPIGLPHYNPNVSTQASREEYPSPQTPVSLEKSRANNPYNFHPTTDSIHDRPGCREEINTADVERRARPVGI